MQQSFSVHFEDPPVKLLVSFTAAKPSQMDKHATCALLLFTFPHHLHLEIQVHICPSSHNQTPSNTAHRIFPISLVDSGLLLDAGI